MNRNVTIGGRGESRYCQWSENGQELSLRSLNKLDIQSLAPTNHASPNQEDNSSRRIDESCANRSTTRQSLPPLHNSVDNGAGAVVHPDKEVRGSSQNVWEAGVASINFNHNLDTSTSSGDRCGASNWR